MMLAVLNTAPYWFGSEQASLEHEAYQRLLRLERRHGGYLKHLGFYNGELDSDEGRQALSDHALGNSPGLLIAAGPGSYQGRSAARAEKELDQTIEILLISQHLRSLPSRLRGDANAGIDDPTSPELLATGDPGVYRMMRDVRRLLAGRDSTVQQCGVWDVVRHDVVIQVPALTLWRMQFVVPYRWIRENLEDDIELPITSIVIDHNLSGYEGEPLGNPIISKELPL